MKKLMVLLFMLVLVAPANAYYYESFGGHSSVNTFAPRSYNNGFNGGYNTSVNNFGTNAPFTQSNIDRTIRQQRQIEYEKKYLKSLENTQNINVNVNHNGVLPPPPPDTYYNNGYNRYYNNVYTPASGIYYNRGNGFTVPGVRMY